jgi:von Willebrand factor type A domain
VCLLLANPFFSLFGLTIYAQTNSYSTQVLTLAVRDRQGRFVTDIQPNQIVIKGQAANVQRLELDNAPRRILLLLDTSGSMGNYKSLSWSNVAQFATQFTLQRKGDDLIGLDTFAEKDQMLVSFTVDSQLVVRHIEALTSSGRGRTMLGLALSEILARREDGLRFGDAIILVSEGDRSDADKTDFTRLRDDITRAGIRICMVRVPPIMGPGATRIEVSDASGFVKDTGGIEFNVINVINLLNEVQPFSGSRVDPEKLDSTAQAAYAFARTYYRVGLEVSGPIQKPRQLTLEVLDQQKRSMKHLQLNYPRYLLPVQCRLSLPRQGWSRTYRSLGYQNEDPVPGSNAVTGEVL